MNGPAIRRPWLPAGMLAAVLGAVTLFYGRYLLESGRVPVGDIRDNYFYLFTHLAARYRAGELPLWSPNYYAGHPFFGNMPSIFYPGDGLFVLLPVPLAFVLDRWVHVLLGAAATYGVARRLGLAQLGAFVAGVLYTCSGNPWEHARGGHVYMVRTAMWFPVLLWAWFALWDTGRFGRAFALTALAAGGLFLSGHPQLFTYGTLIWGLFVLVAAAGTARADGAKRTLQRVGWSAAAGATGLLVAAPQLLPLAELAGQTSRRHVSAAVAGGLAWPTLGWLHTLWPRLMITGAESKPPLMMPHAEHGAYLGALAICLCAAGGVSRGWRGRRFALLAAGFGVLYALGHQTFLLRWAVAVLPPLGQFRIPARMLFVAVWGIALLAGRGADVLTGRAPASRLTTGAIIAVCVAGAGAGALVLQGRMAGGQLFLLDFAADRAQVAPVTSWKAAALWGPLLSLPVAAAGAYAVRRRAGPRLGAWALALGLLANLWVGYRMGSPLDFEEPPAPLADLEPATPLGRVFVPRTRRGAMASLLTGERNLDGSGPFMLGGLEAYLGRSTGLWPVRDAGYALDPGLADCARVAGYTLLDIERARCRQDGALAVQAFPRGHAWFPETVRVAPNEKEALAAVTAPEFDPATVVVLLAGGSVPEVSAGGVTPLPALRLEAHGNHSQTWRVATKRAGVFVVSELYYPGWRVYVDGERRPALRADFLLRGVAVDAGTHTVAWRYQPLSYLAGGLLCLLGLTIVGAGARRRNTGPGPGDGGPLPETPVLGERPES